MRVAHILCTAGTSGVESYLLCLVSALDRSEVDVTVFCSGRGPLVERLEEARIPVELGAPLRKLDFAAEKRLANRWAGSFDLIHAHGTRAAFWAERAARRARLPLVVTMHELRWRTRRPSLRRGLWIALERTAMRGAARLITVSDAMRRDLIGRFPELAERTITVHPSTPMLIDPDRLPRARPDEETPGSPLRLATVGRFDRERGHDVLLRCMAELERRGVNFVIDWVGFGAEEARLRSLAMSLGVDRRVRWLGRDDDLPRTLAGCHAFVTAPRAESFGIAVLEAMAIGLPVVAPAVGGLVELVGDGENGVLVSLEPETTLPARMAEAIAHRMVDPETRARLGARSLRRAREEFAPRRLASGVTEIYRRVVGTVDAERKRT